MESRAPMLRGGALIQGERRLSIGGAMRVAVDPVPDRGLNDPRGGAMPRRSLEWYPRECRPEQCSVPGGGWRVVHLG